MILLLQFYRVNSTMADDMMELLEGDVLDVIDSDDDTLERYYDPDDELPEALRAKMAEKEMREAGKASSDPDDDLAATVRASLEESEAAEKNAAFDEDELAAAVRASIAASEAEAEKAAFDEDELEAAMRESMKMMEANRADSCTTSRLSPIAVAPPSEQDRPGSLTGGYGLPPGLPQVFLPPVLTPPPGLPSPPGLLHPPGLGAPPGLPHPPGLPLPPPGIPFRISRDSGIAGDHSPTESEEAEKYGSEHGSNTQSESSADGNVEEEDKGDEASTETCTVVDGTKDLDYATPFDDPCEQETTVNRSKNYHAAKPFADHSVRVWAKLEVSCEGVYSREAMQCGREAVEHGGSIITLANYDYFDERVLQQLNKNTIQRDWKKTQRFADETPQEKEERQKKHAAAMAKAQEKKAKDQERRAKKLTLTTGQNLKSTIPHSKFSDFHQKRYEMRQKDELSTADANGGSVDDEREQYYSSIQFASERTEKAEESRQWNEDGTRAGSEEASQSGEERRGSMEDGSECSGKNTSSNSRRGSGSSQREDDGYTNEECSDYRSAEKRDSQDSRTSRFSRPSNRRNDEENGNGDEQEPCAFGNIHEVVEPATEPSSDYYNEAVPIPRSAFASVVRDEEVRERSDTFESRGTEGTGVYGSADDRSFDARSPPEGSYVSRDRASTQSSFRNDFDGMKVQDNRDSEWQHRKEDRKEEEPVLERYNNPNDTESGPGWGNENEQRNHSRHTDNTWNSNGRRDRYDSDRQINESSHSSQHASSERGDRGPRENWDNHNSNGRRDDEERQVYDSSQHARSEREGRDSRENWNTHESNGRRDRNDDDRQMNESHAAQYSRSDWNDRDTRGGYHKEEQKAKNKEVVYERFRDAIGSGQGWGSGGGWPDNWNSWTGDRDSRNSWNARPSRDEDWKHSRNADNSGEERRDRDAENHHQNRGSRNAYDDRDDPEPTYRGSQHSDDGRRDTRDQRGPNNSHDDQYHHDYSRDIANSSHGSHFRSQADNHHSRDNGQQPDAFGNNLERYLDAEQLEFNRRSPHSRSGDDRDRQQQFSLNTIPMDADRAARFLNVVGDSKDFHGSSRMSQASRGSGRSNFDQRNSRDHHEDEYPRGSRGVNEPSRMSQSRSSGHLDERHRRDTDNSRQFGGSRDRVDDRGANGSYAGSNDHRERAQNNNSREWHEERQHRDQHVRRENNRRDHDSRSEASRYSDKGQCATRDSRDEYNTRNTDRHSQGSRSYAGSNVDHRDHRDSRDSRDWNDTRDSTRHSQHSRTSNREERDQRRNSREHHRESNDYPPEHEARSQASRSYAGSNYAANDDRSSNHASREAINDRAHERPRQVSRASAREDSDLARRESRVSGSSRNSRGDPMEQYNERKARDEKEEMERREKEWKLGVVYEEQVLRARMRTKHDEPLCGYLAKEYGVEKPALNFLARQPSENTTWVRGRTEFMAHVYYPKTDTAEAVEDDVIQRWYKEGMMHPSVLFSMKYGDWKAFHSQEAWLGEKDWVETPFHGQLDVRRRESEIEMDEFRFGEWTDEVLHIMQQHDKEIKSKQ